VTTSLPFADAFNQGELGISWVRRAGNFKIIGDHAAGTLASPNINLTTLASVNAPNIAVQADIHLSRIGDEVGLVANFTNASNYYVGRVVKTSTGHALSIQKIVGGVTTTLGAVSNVAGALTGSIKFQVLGPTLKLFMNGVEQLSRTDLALSRGTAGIRSKGTGGIDNVSVSDPAIVPFADTFGVSALDPRWVTRTGGFTTTGAETAKGTAATNLMTLGRLDAADVDVQAVINLSNLTGEFASLVARHTGAGDLNMYLATIAYNGTQFVASIQKRVNGVTTTLASVNLGVGEGTLRFTVVGGKLTLFFDGTQVLSVYDFTFKTGSAGLRSSLTPTFDELFVNPTA
jgi:hypothetical protein